MAHQRCLYLETEIQEMRLHVRDSCDQFFMTILHHMHEVSRVKSEPSTYEIALEPIAFLDLVRDIVAHLEHIVGAFFINTPSIVPIGYACSSRLYESEQVRSRVARAVDSDIFVTLYAMLFLEGRYFHAVCNELMLGASEAYTEIVKTFANQLHDTWISFLRSTDSSF